MTSQRDFFRHIKDLKAFRSGGSGFGSENFGSESTKNKKVWVWPDPLQTRPMTIPSVGFTSKRAISPTKLVFCSSKTMVSEPGS